MLKVLFILILVQGLVSSEEENEIEGQSCVDIIENSNVGNYSGGLPDAEQLPSVCPVLKEYVDCHIRSGVPLYRESFRSMRRFLDDLCDETSELHNAYIDNIVCYRSMVNEMSKCREATANALDVYANSGFAFQRSKELDEELSEEGLHVKEYYENEESYCLVRIYPLICMGVKILEACGSGAYDTYIDIVRSTGATFHICDDVALENFVKGYSEFLSSENKSTEVDLIREFFIVKTDDAS